MRCCNAQDLKGGVKFPILADIGSADNSGIAASGLRRAFSWGDTTLGVKNLYYKQKANRVTTDQSLYGVTLVVTFKF